MIGAVGETGEKDISNYRDISIPRNRCDNFLHLCYDTAQ